MPPSPFAARFWPAHLIMVVLLAAAVLLGVWQIDVYRDHRAAAAIDRTRDPAVTLDRALGPDQAFPGDAVGRPVDLQGTWLGQDTVLVGGREQGGQRGYWMVTPLRETSSGSSIPVVLGWTTDPSRVPAAPTGEARLTAWLQPSQTDADAGTDAQTTSTGALVTGEATTGAGARVEVLPTLQTSELVQLVRDDLYDGYAVAKGGQVGLDQADLPKLPDAGPWTSLRNLLYGVQWWVFGGFAVLMWWRWLTEARAEAAEQGDEDAPGDPADDTLVDPADGTLVDTAGADGPAATGEGGRPPRGEDHVGTVKA